MQSDCQFGRARHPRAPHFRPNSTSASADPPALPPRAPAFTHSRLAPVLIVARGAPCPHRHRVLLPSAREPERQTRRRAPLGPASMQRGRCQRARVRRPAQVEVQVRAAQVGSVLRARCEPAAAERWGSPHPSGSARQRGRPSPSHDAAPEAASLRCRPCHGPGGEREARPQRRDCARHHRHGWLKKRGPSSEEDGRRQRAPLAGRGARSSPTVLGSRAAARALRCRRLAPPVGRVLRARWARSIATRQARERFACAWRSAWVHGAAAGAVAATVRAPPPAHGCNALGRSGRHARGGDQRGEARCGSTRTLRLRQHKRRRRVLAR